MKRALTSLSRIFGMPQFVLLDNALAGYSSERTFLFSDPIKEITAFSCQDVETAFREVDLASRKFWLAGYIHYEAGYGFGSGQDSFDKKSSVPLLWFGVYRCPRIFKKKILSPAAVPLLQCADGISFFAYARAFEKIKNELRRGNSYQVNLTFDKHVEALCSQEALYAYLRARQATPFCAAIRNQHEEILSFSPEMFFRRDGNFLMTKPMKGTAPRSLNKDIDRMNRRKLAQNVKDRAENLMIVDLLRNDVGKISVPGSVSVSKMFSVETHPTVHQMTSTITGQLRDQTTYTDIFKALFPCGSVTGAPKIKTMEIIRNLEKGQRGVYCGAIGYIAPSKKSTFSVPIRTLQRRIGEDVWRYRTGSGVVWDSDCEKEWDECQLKAEFLGGLTRNDFSLLETIAWCDGVWADLAEHIARMYRSVKYFGWPVTETQIKSFFAQCGRKLPVRRAKLVRVTLNSFGHFRSEIEHLRETPAHPDVSISSVILDKGNEMLRHKTTYRPWYDQTMEKIHRGKVWDELFFNQDGEISEGARSNIFLKIRGRLYTPPVICGLLPGILRAKMLKSKLCAERILRREDLKNAEKIYAGNSVRGLVEVRLKM